jgi:hypothetical protein
MPRFARRVLLCVAGLIALTPLFAGDAGSKKPTAKIEYFKGKVVPLADIASKSGVRLDADAAPHWLALVGEDGTIYPLVKDSGSRLFFQDRELLRRPMRITGRLLPKSQLLQATAVHSYVKGQLHEVYYWCEVCSIRRGEKNDCECCGAPMVRREEPIGK